MIHWVTFLFLGGGANTLVFLSSIAQRVLHNTSIQQHIQQHCENGGYWTQQWAGHITFTNQLLLALRITLFGVFDIIFLLSSGSGDAKLHSTIPRLNCEELCLRGGGGRGRIINDIGGTKQLHVSELFVMF